MRRFSMIAATGLLAALNGSEAVAQQKGALLASATIESDSVTRATAPRAGEPRRASSRRDDPTSPRRNSAEPTRVTLTAVSVAGRPGSLEVVGIPIPSAIGALDTVRYHIVPEAGVRLVGRTQGTLVAGAPRPSALMITVSAPTSAAAGRVRVASAQFDGPVGMAPMEVPIEMTVLPVHRVEVTVIDQLVGARRGDVTTVRYRAVNFGNMSDSVTLTAEVPAGWRVTNAGQRSLALPVRAARDGAMRIFIPEQAPPGTSLIRIIASSGGAVVSAVDVRVEIENPNARGSQQGPRLTVGSAFTSLGEAGSASAYMATLEGQLSDSTSISARGTWRQGASATGVGTDLALMRVGVPIVPPSLSITSPSLRVGLGLTGGALSDLTGSYLSGNGVSVGSRLGTWRLSGMAARPYTYGTGSSDTATGMLANARVEHAVGSGAFSITATHLTDPMAARQLDAASVGASMNAASVGELTSEFGYRRYATGSGLGWSAELRRQTEDGFVSLRTMHAPGGTQAYARATDDFSAAGSRRFGDWFSFNGAYWQNGDASSVFGSSSGSGWNAGPAFSSRSLGANLSVQARGSSINVTGQSGRFGNGETQVAALLDVHRGSVFANGSATVGRISRTLSAGDEDLPELTGESTDLRGSLGTMMASGTLQFDASTQAYDGAAGLLPRRTALAVRADHIALPLSERMRVYAGAVVERLGFSSADSPISTRLSLTAPLGFGFDVTMSAERNPFLMFGANGARGGWMTAIRIDHSQYLPRLVSPGETFRVYRDVNGNGARDRGESGFAGLVVRCGSRTVATDSEGRFKCDGNELAYVDPRSLPAGWIAPGIRREHAAAGDIGLVAVTAVRVHIDLLDVDSLRVSRGDLEKLVVVARDTANQPWLARDLGKGEVVFDALPPGRYTVDVDASGIEEPLRVRGRPEFTVGEGARNDLHVVLTGRTVRTRVLPPTQSGGASGAGATTDSTSGRTRSSARTASRENLP